MVSQGVKNPLIDLTALEDKTLDEVSTWEKKTENKKKIQKKPYPFLSYIEVDPSFRTTANANSKTNP